MNHKRSASYGVIARQIERRYQRVSWFLVLVFLPIGACAFYGVTADNLDRQDHIVWGIALVTAVATIVWVLCAMRYTRRH